MDESKLKELSTADLAGINIIAKARMDIFVGHTDLKIVRAHGNWSKIYRVTEMELYERIRNTFNLKPEDTL